MGKILAVDYGKKKFGLAISDELAMVTAKLPVLWINKQIDMFEGLKYICKETQPTMILFGLPYGADGGDTIQSLEIKKFISDFQEHIKNIPDIANIPIKTWDESFSTQTAEMGKTRKFKKEKSDSEAARIFLQEYLDSPENKMINS